MLIKALICAVGHIHASCRLLPLTSHMWSRPANMDGDVQMVKSEDQEMYRRRCETQKAISAVRAYICFTKKKPQNLKYWELHKPESLTALSTQ